MSDATSQELGVLAKLVILLAIVLIIAGALWHGVTVATFHRFWHDLVERPDEPMRFRFVLQPLMATIVAIHDGREDARAGRSAYFMTVLRNPQERQHQAGMDAFSAQSAGARRTAARGIERDRQNHSSGAGDGRHLSALRAQDILSE